MAKYFSVEPTSGKRFQVEWSDYDSGKEPKNMQFAEFLALVTKAAARNGVEPPLRLMFNGTALDRHNYAEVASDNFDNINCLMMVPNKEASRSAGRESIFGKGSSSDDDSTAASQYTQRP